MLFSAGAYLASAGPVDAQDALGRAALAARQGGRLLRRGERAGQHLHHQLRRHRRGVLSTARTSSTTGTSSASTPPRVQDQVGRRRPAGLPGLGRGPGVRVPRHRPRAHPVAQHQSALVDWLTRMLPPEQATSETPMQINLLYRPSQTLAQVWLAPGESVIAESGAMVGMTTNVQMQTQSGGLMSGLKRIFGGESFFRNTFTAQGGQGEVLFAPPLCGDMAVLDVGQQQWPSSRAPSSPRRPGRRHRDQGRRLQGLLLGRGPVRARRPGPGPGDRSAPSARSRGAGRRLDGHRHRPPRRLGVDAPVQGRQERRRAGSRRSSRARASCATSRARGSCTSSRATPTSTAPPSAPCCRRARANAVRRHDDAQRSSSTTPISARSRSPSTSPASR
jgi:hypothetical protein